MSAEENKEVDSELNNEERQLVQIYGQAVLKVRERLLLAQVVAGLLPETVLKKNKKSVPKIMP